MCDSIYKKHLLSEEPFEAYSESGYDEEIAGVYPDFEQEADLFSSELGENHPEIIMKRIRVLNTLYKLYKAGRLGWKVGRWLDKYSGKMLGKPISSQAADGIYKVFGRSRTLEDAYDKMPRRLRRWLDKLVD